QASRLFTFPTLAGLLYNACLIGFLLGARSYPVVSLGLGGLAGVMAQVLALAVFARRIWPEWGIQFKFTHPMLKKVWKLMIPIFIGTGVAYINLIVDRVFASLLPVGTIAAMNFAIRVKEIPMGLFAVALSQAIYPVTSLQVARGETTALRNLFSRSLETLWLFIVPSIAGIMVLSQETIAFLFERGAFTRDATIVTAQALRFYVPGLLANASLDIVGRIFYSFQDTTTPVKVSMVGLAMNIVFNALLIHRLAHRGLALATSLSATFVFLVLLEILRRRMRGVEGKILLRNLGKIVGATVLMAIFLVFLRPIAKAPWGYLGAVITGMVVYGVLVLLFRPRSSENIIAILKRIWGKICYKQPS
ncbi:MAG: lipid II flippase MurJ, partial [Atribacterota bacterium]